MRRRFVLFSPLWLAADGGLRGNPAGGDARLEKLYLQFVAPCCWRENLLVHSSPKTEELRAEIRRRVKAGQTDAQIKEAFIAQYTIRILPEPEGVRGQLLFWTPVAAGIAGCCGVLAVIRHLRGVARPVAAAVEVVHLPDLGWGWDDDQLERRRGAK